MSQFKYDNFTEEYELNEESIDEMSARVEDFLYALKMDRANALGIRLSIEEALLRWRDHFSTKEEAPKVRFYAGKRFFRPIISIELKGEGIDPFEEVEGNTDSGDWVGTVMANIGLSPKYSYENGVNTLQLRLNRPRLNPGITLLVGILAGVVIGLLARMLAQHVDMEDLTYYFFMPLQSVFFRILQGTSGPVIFFTVLTAICGIGSAALMNKSGKRLIARFLLSSALLTVIYMALIILLLRPSHEGSALGITAASMFGNLFEFVPGDIISPFLYTDSPQLILLAIIIGNALLMLGSQGDRLVKIANQANSVGLLVAEWISRIVPYFVAIILAFRILDGTIVKFKGILIPILSFHLFIAGAFMIMLLVASRKYGVPVRDLWAKIKPSFMLALRDASVNSAFGENALCCERKLGISKKLTRYGLPLGLVIYMPASTVSLMASTMFAVHCYDVIVTPHWFILAVILVVALQAASPPVSGVDTLAYVAIFSRLGIPSEALIMAIVCDIIFGFASSAFNQAMLQLDLLNEADRLNLLNRDVLRK